MFYLKKGKNAFLRNGLLFYFKRRKMNVLRYCLTITFFNLLILVIFMIPILRDFASPCSPLERFTGKTWDPFDEALFCTPGKQLVPTCLLDITKQLSK